MNRATFILALEEARRRNFIRVIAAVFALALFAGGTTTFAQAPSIDFTSPVMNALHVSVTVDIVVTFNTDIDTASITTSSFVVHGRSTGSHMGSFVYDAPSKTITFDPGEDFEVGEVVTVVLTADIQASDGTPLEVPYVWSFTCQVFGGTGVFPVAHAYPVGEEPLSIFAADLDDNGAIDLASAGSGGVYVNLNNGDGTFSPFTAYFAGQWPAAVAGGDIDQDGDIDLVTANQDSEQFAYISVLLNNGNGSFSLYVPYQCANTGSSPTSVAVADLDGDGDLDVATANSSGGSVSVIANNGDGTFGSFISYPLDGNPSSVLAVELDNDADIDLLVGNASTDFPVTVLWNDGDGSFQPLGYGLCYSGPLATCAADLDSDGDNDILIVYEQRTYFSERKNNGDGTFGCHCVFDFGPPPSLSIAAGDLDGDGDPDVAVGRPEHYMSIFYDYFLDSNFFEAGSYPRAILAADFDGDGDNDIAAANRTADSITVLFNGQYLGSSWHVATDGDDETGDGSPGRPFATIQNAIDAASDGEAVVIHPGTYTGEGNRDLDFKGKAILVTTESEQAPAIIDCEGSELEPHRGFTFHSNEDTSSVLQGLRITGAYSDSGAIFITNATPTIRNCEVTGNFASGIRCDSVWLGLRMVRIDSCTISYNTGHGVKAWAARAAVTNSVIANNGETGFWAYTLYDDCLLVNSIFVYNKRGMWWDATPSRSETGDAPAKRFDTAVIQNSIFAFNLEQGIQYGSEPIEALAACNDSYGNPGGDWVGIPWGPGDTLGNISEDPLFCNVNSGDFGLQEYSPCLPEHNSCGVHMGAFQGIGCFDCCRWRGNVNGDAVGAIGVADLTFLVDYLFFGGSAPPCEYPPGSGYYPEGDVDGSGAVNIVDLVYLVDYLFFGGPGPPPCP